MKWTKLFSNDCNLNVLTKVMPTKGNLVYEYNPFRNFRITQNMYEYQDSLYSLGDLWNIFQISIQNCIATRSEDSPRKYEFKFSENSEETTDPQIIGQWIHEAFSDGHVIDRQNLEQALIESDLNDTCWYNVPDSIAYPYLREKGELCDFVTDQLNFSLENPVHIVPQYSYDGSVNLILNDGKNSPRLINSRFSSTGKNTYEVVDRKGNNDTNIYDQGDQFDLDTSLYKRVIKIPKIKFQNVSAGGGLKIGNYHFYFKLSDADGNETDFVGESGLVSVFIGFADPKSVTTGQKHENSFKSVNFQVSNIDSAYDFVTVYYTRSTSEGLENAYTEYKKVQKKYPINNANICNITITGFEEQVDIAKEDINLFYNVVDSVITSASCQNMLFLANVHKPDIPYQELSDLSLRFLPYLKQERYGVDMDHNYQISTSVKGYIDPTYIYNKTGYWGKEIYRLGIVYILNNGELSPVFNIRGGYGISEYSSDNYSVQPVWNIDGTRNYISYNEETYLLENPKCVQENIKGVVSFNPNKDTDTIYGIDIRVDDDTIQELKKYIKGYFFVRQTRIPTILAQGITIGIDKESHTPTIPTADGFLTQMADSLTKTHVTTKDINDVNFISEGFLKRYSFTFKKKDSGMWSYVAVGAAIIAIAAAAAFTCGAAGALLPAVGAAIGVKGAAAAATAITLKSVLIAGATALTSTAGLVGVGVGAAVVVGSSVAAGIQDLRYAVGQNTHKSRKMDGRNTKAPPGMKIVEVEESRILTQDFLERYIVKDPSANLVSGILCPDYEVNSPYFNQIFTGNTHLIELTKSQNTNCLNGHSSNYFTNDERHFYVPAYYDKNVETEYNMKIIPVPDNVKCVGLDSLKFRSRAGEAEEAWRYECIAEDYKSEKVKGTAEEDSETVSNKKINTDIIRGSFGPYLAINDSANRLQPAETVNIYIPQYSKANMHNYFYIRMVDHSPFFAISDRIAILDVDDYLIDRQININNNIDRSGGYQHILFRGDCYLCQFTHRVNRNFNDPSAPYNDDLVDDKTWKDNYNPEDTTKYEKINLGDVNAIQLGMWVTFKVRSSFNLNIRTLDGSYVDETAMQGHPRGYYPYHEMSVEGTFKHPEALVYNKGFAKSVSERWNFELPDVPHIKNWFKTRILYSDIHVNDAYKNGYRVFQGNHYRDYTREYGEIVKLIPFESNLLCIFEHGIALIPINERAVAGEGSGGTVYINTSNVLPENPKIISDIYGSQWADSVIKIPGKTGDSAQYVYGVDTVAKKIWRTDGNSLICISDFRVQEFLNNNITLGERELTPKLGIRNVKTVYNAYKKDVLFTFYDNTYGFEEKVWNLCWNETLEKFITFYSWVPSFMENINNIPFSFNRDTSKWLSKLGTSHTESSFADGITLSNVVIGKENVLHHINDEYYQLNDSEVIGILSLSNRILPESFNYQISYTFEDGSTKKNNFEISNYSINNGEIVVPVLKYTGNEDDLRAYFYYKNIAGHAYSDDEKYKIDPSKNIVYYKNTSENTEFSGYEHIVDNYYKQIKEDIEVPESFIKIDVNTLPIFKDKSGKRPNLPNDPPEIVKLLNIKAKISITTDLQTNENNTDYYNLASGYEVGTSLIDAGYYESTIAVIYKDNLQLLSTDFWKHGQAGLIDIADDIYPTNWYGKTHPFEFECIVVNDPAMHKIFSNLELIANKAVPESFHYEIVGESYDFNKDKPNMFYRQEALKEFLQLNGEDITFDRNYRKVQTNQLERSTDLVKKYYERQDTINEIEDSYNKHSEQEGFNFNHLSGSEIVYYPNRQEFRIATHAQAKDIDSLNQDTARSIIEGNCKYLEDRWRITLNPILVSFCNESEWNDLPLLVANNTTFVKYSESEDLEDYKYPEGYSENDWSKDKWSNRKELDIKDKFIKIRIRYSGKELAIINFLNTIYRISFS